MTTILCTGAEPRTARRSRGQRGAEVGQGRCLAESTGAFVNDGPVYVQSTGFVLNLSGQAVISVYSGGAIGNRDQRPGWPARTTPARAT